MNAPQRFLHLGVSNSSSELPDSSCETRFVRRPRRRRRGLPGMFVGWHANTPPPPLLFINSAMTSGVSRGRRVTPVREPTLTHSPLFSLTRCKENFWRCSVNSRPLNSRRIEIIYPEQPWKWARKILLHICTEGKNKNALSSKIKLRNQV